MTNCEILDLERGSRQFNIRHSLLFRHSSFRSGHASLKARPPFRQAQGPEQVEGLLHPRYGTHARDGRAPQTSGIRAASMATAPRSFDPGSAITQ